MAYLKTKKQKFLLIIFFFLIIAGSFGFKGSSFLTHPALAQVTLTDMSPDPGSAATQDQIDSIGKGTLNPIKIILVGVLSLMGFLIRVATALFNWAIDSKNMSDVLTNGVIYTTWALVRDTLNIAFILVLLFSAFSTVFQVDKYSYKRLLLTLVLMALLVNFSFPITRFIIDFSNSLMYYLINSSGIGISNVNAAFPSIAADSQLGKILGLPASATILSLLAAIIFTWILAITLLIIAGLFVIRTVALAILIIFSPIAFTGSIIPFSASYASKWWDSLFKYAFFGPVMVFMLGVSVKMMAAIQTKGMVSMENIAGQQSADPNLLAAVSFFIIPLIILWAGIIFAQQMSLTGASAVIGRGQKFMKWAPNSVFKATGIPGGVKKAADHYSKKGAPMFLGKIPGLRGSEKTEATEDRLSGFFTKGPKGWKNANVEMEKKAIAETRKKWKDNGGATDSDISAALKSPSQAVRRAAAIEASEKVGFGDSKVALENYKKALAAVHGNADMENSFNGKVKEKHIKLLIENDIATNKLSPVETYKKHLSELNAEGLAKQKGLHEDLKSNPAFLNYLNKEIKTDTDHHKELFKRLTKKQREEYFANGVGTI